MCDGSRRKTSTFLLGRSTSRLYAAHAAVILQAEVQTGHMEKMREGPLSSDTVSKVPIIFRAPEYCETLLVQECAVCKISIQACTSVSDNEQGSSVLPELFLCPKQTEPLL